MNNLAKEINQLLLENETIKEYLDLKEEIKNDNVLTETYKRLDSLRKQICRDKSLDSSEYYELLKEYKNDYRVQKYEKLQKEIQEYFAEISDILSLK